MKFSLELRNAPTAIPRSGKVLIDFIIGRLKPYCLHNVTVLLCDQFNYSYMDRSPHFYPTEIHVFKYHLVPRYPCLHLLTLN